MSEDGRLRIAAIRLVCRDVEATVAFYEAAFGCRRVKTKGADAAVMLGEQRLEFVHADAAGNTDDRSFGSAVSNSTAFQHCAIVVSGMTDAMALLNAFEGWTAISTHGPEKLPQASGGVTAFKFRDPEGHPLEFLEFPAGCTPHHWQHIIERSGKGVSPFLGIDHSAITVADTATSLAFYERLGFTVSSQQINSGAEQARLDALDDPVLKVIGLMPPNGAPPHLELLCYLKPSIVVQPVSNGDALATRLRLSLKGFALPDAKNAYCDPDGHRFI